MVAVLPIVVGALLLAAILALLFFTNGPSEG
jgi:hypothetical protein